MARYAWLLAPVLLAPALSQAAVSYGDAKVIGVDPTYETVQVSTPRQVCHDEQYQVDSRDPTRSYAVPLIGAAIGGALGHTIGHTEKDNNLGAVVGALFGGAVGYGIASRPGSAPATYQQTRQVCTQEADVHSEQRITGYRVRYRYQGETYVMETDRPPEGDTVRVRVEVTPVS